MMFIVDFCFAGVALMSCTSVYSLLLLMKISFLIKKCFLVKRSFLSSFFLCQQLKREVNVQAPVSNL